MSTKELTADQWRRIAVEALADLEAIGAPVSELPAVKPHQEIVMKEVDKYAWEREKYI